MVPNGWIAADGVFSPTMPGEPVTTFAARVYGVRTDRSFLLEQGWIEVFNTGDVVCHDPAAVTDAQLATVRDLYDATVDRNARAAMAGFFCTVLHARRKDPCHQRMVVAATA